MKRNTNTHRVRYHRGYSLIEMVVTLGIVGILSTLTIPHLSLQRERLTVSSEAARLRLFLEYCSTHAITSREQVALTVSHDIITATREQGKELRRHSLRHGTTINLGSGATSAILFHPTLSASPATLLLTKGGASCSVIISLRTRVRIVC